MPVRPFVSMQQLGSHSTDFHLIRYLRIFRKSVEKNSIFIKILKEQRVLHMRTYVHLMYIYDKLSLNPS